MGYVLVSYQPGAASAYAIRLHTALARRLGGENVALHPPDAEAPESTAPAAHLVLVEPSWLDPTSGSTSAGDPVASMRASVARSLQTPNASVIAVLLDDTDLPTADRLPTELQSLVQGPRIRLTDTTFDDDIDRLLALIGTQRSETTSRVCGQCGFAVSSDDSFCPACGAYLDWDGEPDRSPRYRGGSSGPASATPPPRPGGPAQVDETVAAAPSINDIVRAAITDTVTPGLLAFNPPTEMRQGRLERVEVRVARSGDLQELLTTGLRGRGVPITEEIETSPFMGVELFGDGFEVKPLSATEQLVAQLACWEYDVRPLRAGTLTLVLSVTMRIALPERPDERIAVPVFERSIRVRIDPVYRSRQFVADNWQWLTATALGVGGALAAWRQFLQ